MSERKSWSEDLKSITEDVLYNMPVESFAANTEGCRMKHISRKYGYITLQDALSNKYNIHVENNNGITIEEYSSINDLLENGWVVD